MNTLCQHIECLLIEHNCVIVPHLGGFVAHECSAQYVETEQLFLPPYRNVSFNQLLQHNDGLLAEAYMKSFGINYADALREIHHAVSRIKTELEHHRQLELNGLGTLRAGEGSHYEFLPAVGGLIAPQHYALDSVWLASPNAMTVSEPVSRQHPHRINLKTRRQEALRWGTRLMRYAAAVMILLFYFVWTAPLNHHNGTVQQQAALIEVLSSLATTPRPSVVQTATAPSSKTETAPPSPSTPSATSSTQTQFVIVLASHVSRAGAIELATEMEKAGFVPTHLYENKRIRRVVYGQYTSSTAAQSALHTLRKQDAHFQQAWVLKLS